MRPDSPDSLSAWMDYYQQAAVHGVRSKNIAKAIARHLSHFLSFYENTYGHDQIKAWIKRDVMAWQTYLHEDLEFAASTVNSYMASLSAFGTWIYAQAPHLLSMGDPTKGIGELALPPLEPRTLNADQVRTLKNICDRLADFHRLKGQRWANRAEPAPLRKHSRPLRDRAIVFTLLSTGLRREELVNLDADQVEPPSSEGLRESRKARITRVQGKGKTERIVFLSKDTRLALADYLAHERMMDINEHTTALFLSASSVKSRSVDGRLSPRVINQILDQIGRWHDAELDDKKRHISPLRPHDLRHTFAFNLAQVTQSDSYELSRRLGHRSQRYIERYTNPPEDIAAEYIESF